MSFSQTVTGASLSRKSAALVLTTRRTTTNETTQKQKTNPNANKIVLAKIPK